MCFALASARAPGACRAVVEEKGLNMRRLGEAAGLRPRSLWYASLLALLCGLVVVMAVPGGAAGPATKLYSVDIAPTTAASGSTATYTLTLRNDPTSTHSLGSANVTVPTGSGFTVTDVGDAVASSGETWSTLPRDGVIEFRASSSGDALAARESVSTQLTIVTDCDATSGATWTTAAKQANSFSGPPGNDFKPVGDDPALSVTAGTGGGPLAALVFDPQPTDGEKGSPLPALTVRGVDDCGNTSTGATDTVEIDLGTNPSGAELEGTTTKALVNGVATFNDLTIDRSGLGYALTASIVGGPSSEPSDPFDVFDRLCTSDVDFCEAFDEEEQTYVKTDAPPIGGTMALSFSGSGGTFSCGDVTRAVIGSKMTIDPRYPADVTRAITATIIWDKSLTGGTGVANFVFCLSKNEGATFTVVRQCGKGVGLPCEVKRDRSGEGHLRIVIRLDPQDPIGGLG